MSIFASLLFSIAVLLLLLWAAARVILAGRSHEQYDAPKPPLTVSHAAPSDAHHEVVAELEAAAADAPKQGRREMLTRVRARFDEMGDAVEFDGEIRSVDAGGVAAEWVIAPGAHADRRLLYIHGGAFMLGSPKSHRSATTEYSRRLGVAVLAIDYRLMPENPRSAGIEDCQTAYKWMLENGPDGAVEAECVLVSGDSAGGNLTLMLSAWVRDEGLRAADAAIALSPATDSTFSSPTLKANLETDAMLGPMFGAALAKTPRWIMLWATLMSNRMRPSNPILSPLHGDLSNLPPTLLHVSTAEMLEGDSVRYYNKAKSQGSPVEIGVWPFMLHVWHIFTPRIPEAVEAFEHIEAFVRRNVKELSS